MKIFAKKDNIKEEPTKEEKKKLKRPPVPKPAEIPQPEEKEYTVTYSEEDLNQRLTELGKSKNIELMLKVQKGMKEYEEYKQLVKLLDGED